MIEKPLSSRLQSRIDHRSKHITTMEQIARDAKSAVKALGRWHVHADEFAQLLEQSKAGIKSLAEEQQLDKKLLNLAFEAEYYSQSEQVNYSMLFNRWDKEPSSFMIWDELADMEEVPVGNFDGS